MASIVLSFVGQQDPYSNNTNLEGSIVSLIKYLHSQKKAIKQVILLHTEGTKTNAEDTKVWLQDEPLNLAEDKIELIPVSEQLSTDPVNLLLAIEAAREGIKTANKHYQKGDRLELNASSGTPVMKSAWSSLQAAGYLPHSSIWQVRNPSQMVAGQARVFETNVDTLKKEFDLKAIKRQVDDYNYAGALVTFENSSFADDGVSNLLKYGNCRLSCDFEQAAKAIEPFKKLVNPLFWQEIKQLRQRENLAVLRELYFHSIIRFKNQDYCDFLVLVFAFQESALRYLIKKVFVPESVNKSWQNVENQIEDKARSRLPKLNIKLNRTGMATILRELSQYPQLRQFLDELNEFCYQRNDYIHQFEGVSSLENAEDAIASMKAILSQLEVPVATNSFTTLNQEIAQHLKL